MEDEVYLALGQIEKSMQDSISVYEGASRFTSYVRAITGARISDRAYARLLGMYYAHYRKREKKVQMYYCLLQLERLSLARSSSILSTVYPMIQFTEGEIPILEKVGSRKRALYAQKVQQLEKKWLLVCSLAWIFLMILCVLLLSLNFWAVWIFCTLLWVAAVMIGHFWLVPALVQPAFDGLVDMLDEEHAAFEKGLHMRAPRFPLI